ncbi:ABC transporter permease [Actinomyces sp. zg328]|uniref:ABC transporter permease n=1 Tax=Actinomyces sp. zg328 TaxID=2609287 RepID=UPI00135838F5|nr:ABC transporter permease [Actinomyces sp. zg328]
MSASPTAPPRSVAAPAGAAMGSAQEIRLVAAREFKNQMSKKPWLISVIVMLVVVVGGIIGFSLFTGGDHQAYRVAVAGASPAALPGLSQVTDSEGAVIAVSQFEGDPTGEAATAALAADDDEVAHLDMILDLTGATPVLRVHEKASEQVKAGITAVLQQAALSDRITQLGGDPSAVATALASATPEVDAVSPPKYEDKGFAQRYAFLLTADILLLSVIMGGGQILAMGVVEEKASRIVEILLACVRPTSLLAGKILGIGAATIVSFSLIGIVGAAAARTVGLLDDVDIPINSTMALIMTWMVLGFVLMASLYGAAGALVSRQEDAPSVTTPLLMLGMIPYMASIFMMQGDPDSTLYRVLSYFPLFSPYMMPARQILGVSSPAEQAITMAATLLATILLVKLGSVVYTRAVTRTGSRVPLREVLRRAA